MPSKSKKTPPSKTFPYIFIHSKSQEGSKKSKYMPKWKWDRTIPKKHGSFDPHEFIEDSIEKGSHKQEVTHIPGGGNKRRTRRKKKRRKKGGTLNKKTKRKLDAWGIDVNAKGDLTKFEKKVYPEDYSGYTMKDAINSKTGREFKLMMQKQIAKNKKKGGNPIVENLQSNLENLKENINIEDIKSNLNLSKDFFTKGKFQMDDYNISWCTQGKKGKKSKKGGKARRKTRKRLKRKTKKRKRKTKKRKRRKR